jgi:transposase
LEKLYSDAGILLVFLLPYSSDLNPIEEAFAELKAWMRKNYKLQEYYEIFEGFLEAGISHMASKVGKHFRSYHFDLSDDN